MSGDNFLATVAFVQDAFNVVLNKGVSDNVSIGDVFIVYEIGGEIKDPDTGKSLGALEIVKGRGKVTHIQENMCTVKSNQTERSRVKRTNRNPFSLSSAAMLAAGYGEETVEEMDETIPFDGPKVGDKAKMV